MIKSGFQNRNGIGATDDRVLDGEINLKGLKEGSIDDKLHFYSDAIGVVLYKCAFGYFSFDVKGRLWVYDDAWERRLAEQDELLINFLNSLDFVIEVEDEVIFAISPILY